MSQERVSHSALFAFLAQLFSGVLTALLTIFLGRRLSAPQFGAFTFALSVVMVATLFADAGITPSTARFMAERREQPSSAAAVFRTALRLKVLIGIATTIALLALAGPICEAFGTRSALWAVRWAAIALLAQTIFNLTLGAFVAIGRVRYNLVLSVIESVAEVAASLPLVVLGASAANAALGRAVGFGVGLAAALWLANRVIGRIGSRRSAGGRGGLDAARDDEPAAERSAVAPRRIVGYAGPLLLVEIAFRAFNSIDVLLIAALIAPGAAVASFGLPMRLTLFLEYPAQAAASAVSPRLTRSRSEQDVRLLEQSLRYLAIVQMLFAVPLLIWPEAIINLLFASKYPEAAEVLRALSPFVFLSGFAQLTTLAVNYLGYAWRRVPFAAAMLCVNIAIDATLLPRIGVVAGGIGTSAAYLVWVPAHIWILRRRGGLRIRGFLVTLARTAVAGAAMLGVLALLGSGRVPLPRMLLGAAAGPAMYFAVLVALRELRSGDIAIVRRLAQRAAS